MNRDDIGGYAVPEDVFGIVDGLAESVTVERWQRSHIGIALGVANPGHRSGYIGPPNDNDV